MNAVLRVESLASFLCIVVDVPTVLNSYNTSFVTGSATDESKKDREENCNVRRAGLLFEGGSFGS